MEKKINNLEAKITVFTLQLREPLCVLLFRHCPWGGIAIRGTHKFLHQPPTTQHPQQPLGRFLHIYISHKLDTETPVHQGPPNPRANPVRWAVQHVSNNKMKHTVNILARAVLNERLVVPVTIFTGGRVCIELNQCETCFSQYIIYISYTVILNV